MTQQLRRYADPESACILFLPVPSTWLWLSVTQLQIATYTICKPDCKLKFTDKFTE